MPLTLTNKFAFMGLQVIEDGKGKATGVFIPMREWKILKKQHKDLEALEYTEPTKSQLISELKDAIQELSLVQQGKRKSRPLKSLLNEL